MTSAWYVVTDTLHREPQTPEFFENYVNFRCSVMQAVLVVASLLQSVLSET